MDKIDKKIIEELDKNSRIQAKKLSSICNLSIPAVESRINKIIKNNLIINFYPIIDIFKLGKKNVLLHLSIKNLDSCNKNKKINDLLKLKKVNWISEFFAEFNFALSIVYENHSELITTVNDIIKILGDNILDIEIKFVSKYSLVPHTFEKNSLKEIFVVDNQNKLTIKLSKTEEKILDLISINSRISYVELAKKLKLDPNTISYNLSKMKKNGIIKGYKSLINFKNLGYNWMQIRFKTFVDMPNHLLFEKGVIFVSNCLDGTIILNVLYYDVSEIQEILNNIEKKIGNIYRLNTYEIIEIYKLTA